MNGLLGDAARGLVRGVTADFAGAPVDTLNAIRSGLLGPAQAGNPYAAALGGLLGPVQQVGSGDWIAQQMGLPQGSGMVYETARMLAPSPTEMLNVARRVPLQELITYHGTPHRFEPTPDNPLGELDSSKIGTGEGAQAYGHGIYIAESRKVGEGYKKALSGYEEPFLQFGDTKITGQKLSDVDLEAFKFLEIGKRDAGQFPHNTVYYAKQAAKNNPAVLARLEEMGRDVKFGYEKNPGYLYTLDLPDEMIDRMLDWDKPFSQQPENVKKALLSNKEFNRRIATAIDSYGVDKVTGGNIHSMLSGKPGEIERTLAQMGIPGIKYLDAGSRGKDGTGTRNFVVFPGEEKKVKILKRD